MAGESGDRDHDRAAEDARGSRRLPVQFVLHHGGQAALPTGGDGVGDAADQLPGEAPGGVNVTDLLPPGFGRGVGPGRLPGLSGLVTVTLGDRRCAVGRPLESDSVKAAAKPGEPGAWSPSSRPASSSATGQHKSGDCSRRRRRPVDGDCEDGTPKVCSPQSCWGQMPQLRIAYVETWTIALWDIAAARCRPLALGP